MNSIFQRVLGEDFQRLHPKIQERFGFTSQDHRASIGIGMMDRVWYGNKCILPFLYIGTWRNIMFPQSGNNIPFQIENYAYQDQFGRETITFVRSFQFDQKTRRFDATMIYSEERECIVDYLGTHQHLAVDLDLSVLENGGIHVRSGEQRFYEGWIGIRFPMKFSGIADVKEWYDEEAMEYRIQVVVNNNWLGAMFGYEGRFQVQDVNVNSEDVPNTVKPLREERRE